jgi:glucose/arabinose dehydrogenase
MTQRFLSPRFVAATALALATASIFAVACGSDKREGMDSNMLEPDPTASAGGTAGSGGGRGGQTSSPGGNAGTGPVSSGGSEAQPGETPIDPGAAGAGGADSSPPPEPTVTANCNPPEGEVPALSLTLVADDLDEPIYVTGAPGDDSRLFVLEKGGTVRVLVDGVLQEQPFADISSQVVNNGERGLLGLAFHPQYATNGLFYLHYSSTATDGVEADDGVVAEFSVNANDRSLANADSQRRVLVVGQPQTNHNGGQITFGRDGFLYLGFGDGGGGNDNHGTIGNGQDLNTLLGKILRIDPLGRGVNDAYGIPDGNMVAAAGQQVRGEIWAYGVRNPWRFSFDACNGDLYMGDVGQDTLEEINYLRAAAPAGANFGWRVMEGPNCRNNDAVCAQNGTAGLTLPVDSYPTALQGQRGSVTGGYVYRGSDIPGLRGAYIYADYVRAQFFRFRIEDGQAVDRTDITAQLRPGGGAPQNIASFGQDNDGEVYVAAFNPGAVYRITAAAP